LKATGRLFRLKIISFDFPSSLAAYELATMAKHYWVHVSIIITLVLSIFSSSFTSFNFYLATQLSEQYAAIEHPPGSFKVSLLEKQDEDGSSTKSALSGEKT
jgi:hypothetical protein